MKMRKYFSTRAYKLVFSYFFISIRLSKRKCITEKLLKFLCLIGKVMIEVIVWWGQWRTVNSVSYSNTKTKENQIFIENNTFLQEKDIY